MSRGLRSSSLRLAAGMVLTVLALASAPSARAVDQTLCLRYPVETVDSGLGVDFEDYYSLNDTLWPLWKARGAAYQVVDYDDETRVLQGYTSEVNGCFTIPDAWFGPSRRVTVHFFLDSRFFDHLRVRTRQGTQQNGCDPDPFADHSLEPAWCQPLVTSILSGTLDGDGKKYFDFAPSEEAVIQALAAFPAYRWHHFDPAAVEEDVTISLHHEDACENIPGDPPPCSGTTIPDVTNREILIGIDDTTEHKHRQKFLAAHEMGHALQSAYALVEHGTSSGFSGTYGLDAAADPNCNSGTESHALTSIEFVSAAINEGFAHFISADSYNDHAGGSGRFTYYKDDMGYPRDIDLEGVAVFDAANPHRSNRFAERVCLPTPERAGTELDWLRFFWDLHSGAGADGEHQNLFELRVDGSFDGTIPWDNESGYDVLEEAVCSGSAGAQTFLAPFIVFAGSNDAVGGNGVQPDGVLPSCP